MHVAVSLYYEVGKFTSMTLCAVLIMFLCLLSTFVSFIYPFSCRLDPGMGGMLIFHSYDDTGNCVHLLGDTLLQVEKKEL